MRRPEEVPIRPAGAKAETPTKEAMKARVLLSMLHEIRVREKSGRKVAIEFRGGGEKISRPSDYGWLKLHKTRK
jgi:hypothetical protein